MERQHERWSATCTYCPTLCLFTCPVSNAEGRDTVAPWGKMSLARWLDGGQAALDEDSARVLYKCMGCMACRTPCVHDVEVPEVLFAARARAVAAGVTPFPAATFERDEETAVRKLRLAVPSARFNPEAQVLLVPGHDTLTHDPSLVGRLFDLTNALGVDYLAAGPVSAVDTGYELWAAGHEKPLRRLAERVRVEVGRYRKLVVMSPHDLYMLRVVYPRLGIEVSPAVAYVGELLRDLLAGRRLPHPVSARLTYHDPCLLGRHLEIYDLPRELLRAASQRPPEELRWSRESGYCCGAGGAVAVTSPTTAAHAARTVVDNAAVRGADILVTACATCAHMFRSVADGPRVCDVIDVLADALGRSAPQRRAA